MEPTITKASNLLRDKNQEDILKTLQKTGLPLKDTSIQYNTGFIRFKKNNQNQDLFNRFKQNFDKVLVNQELLLLREQGAFAASIEEVKPPIKVLPPIYNFLDKWKNSYKIDRPIKVLHTTYPYRPQYAKNVTRNLYTKIFDRIAKYLLPNQVKNPWRNR